MKLSDLKKNLQRFALEHGILINKPVSSDEVKQFIHRFKNNFKSVKLLRVGGDGDGGYLMPDILQNIDYCFSPGVDFTANFELELSEKYNIKSFMADASVSGPPFSNKNFSFLKKFLGNNTNEQFITLSDWIKVSKINDSNNLILQMDIEGSEYDVLSYEDSQTLARFSSMIIEFHGFHNIFDKNFFRMASSIFEKIYKNFVICHVHPNNCSGLATLKGIDVPRVFEVTFIRNDLYQKIKDNNEVFLPHKLDIRNIKSSPELRMPEIWWRK